MHSFKICHWQKSLISGQSSTLVTSGYAHSPIETAHCMSALLVFLQNLRDELRFGEIGMVALYVLGSNGGPELQGLVHSEFHR
jgi:hypothetical protein